MQLLCVTRKATHFVLFNCTATSTNYFNRSPVQFEIMEKNEYYRAASYIFTSSYPIQYNTWKRTSPHELSSRTSNQEQLRIQVPIVEIVILQFVSSSTIIRNVRDTNSIVKVFDSLNAISISNVPIRAIFNLKE